MVGCPFNPLKVELFVGDSRRLANRPVQLTEALVSCFGLFGGWGSILPTTSVHSSGDLQTDSPGSFARGMALLCVLETATIPSGNTQVWTCWTKAKPVELFALGVNNQREVRICLFAGAYSDVYGGHALVVGDRP